MNSNSALAGLLQLVAASGGLVSTRIRIQKEAFLLALKGCLNFRAENFSYHHFGPFSRQLSETLKFAVSAGLLEEKEEAFSETTQRYSYYITESARKFLEEVNAIPNEVLNYVTAMNKEHWRSLELAATVAYLGRTKGLSREAAFTAAKELKPDTVPYAEEAKKVLQTLAI
ncbi:MAG: hypothetical protein HY848_16035 [Betaproteobacteria bacterium]|nr:hypothetical protein [Betaproteobacteria bacterium]